MTIKQRGKAPEIEIDNSVIQSRKAQKHTHEWQTRLAYMRWLVSTICEEDAAIFWTFQSPWKTEKDPPTREGTHYDHASQKEGQTSPKREGQTTTKGVLPKQVETDKKKKRNPLLKHPGTGETLAAAETEATPHAGTGCGLVLELTTPPGRMAADRSEHTLRSLSERETGVREEKPHVLNKVTPQIWWLSTGFATTSTGS